MFWIVRGLLVAAGIIASWFVARDALNFSVVQGVIAVMIFGVVVLAVALWPAEWTTRFNRLLKR